MIEQPVLLDLCCCQGGAAAGYRRAGFYVIGADVKNHAARYAGDRFVLGDALDVLDRFAGKIDAVHTSPPCQRWTQGNVANDDPTRDRHPDLIAAHRAALIELGLPYVIENVPRAPLLDPLVLCGTQFGLTAIDTDGTPLHLRRHRHFESNVDLVAPAKCKHPHGVQWAGVYDGARRDKHLARYVRKGGYVPADTAVLADLLGIGWMTRFGLYQAIPPVYTEHIGRILHSRLNADPVTVQRSRSIGSESLGEIT